MNFKYRIYDVSCNKMFQVLSIDFSETTGEIVAITTKYHIYKGEELIENKLMISSGMKDINGKEIFTGDIIKIKTDGEEHILTTIYDNTTKLNFLECYGINLDLKDDTEYIVVLGNIYKNPELLDNKIEDENV